MSIFKGRESAKQHHAKHEAKLEREKAIKLAKPVIQAFRQGPVAVVAMRDAADKRKELLAGIKHSYPSNSVLALNARRVQRLDSENEYVEETLDKLRSFRRRSEITRGSSVVVFTGVRFPRPETVESIGTGTPEVVERVTNMIRAHGPRDPRFLFVGDGAPSDLPSDLEFPRTLDRGILNAVDVTFALTNKHGLTTVLPPEGEVSLANPLPHFRERGTI